jgi:pseudaminic acid synthase
MSSFEINGRKIGKEFPPYIVAEVSANHGGSIELAKQHILSAKESGADAVKIQSYTPDTMTIECDNPLFTIEGGLWHGESLYQLYKKAHTPFEWHEALFAYAKEVGIVLFSTPFDETAVDLLESLNTPAYKIASFEMTDLPLLKYIASKSKPVILSTGMANMDEITEAVNTLIQNGCKDILVLHCISGYPTPIAQANLKTMKALADEFQVEVGLSDHTLGITASLVAVALGACFIEKHFVLDKTIDSPDASFSITPDELFQLTKTALEAWQSLGSVNFTRVEAEEKNVVFRRSLFVVKDIKAGEVLTEENIRRIRPGYGLAPKHYDKVLGMVAKEALAAGTPLEWSYISND